MTSQTARIGFWRYLPANMATCLSLSVAMISIALSFNQHLATAAWCILYCVLLDKLDGLLARLFNAQSNFGMELDSFVDFAAFGLSPSALCWNFMMHSYPGSVWLHPISYIAIIYSITAVLRLVKFNVFQDKLPSNMFLGLPSTISGGAIASMFLVLSRVPYINIHTASFILMLTLLVLGAMMLSKLHMIKLGTSKHKWLNAFALANVLAAYACVILNIYPLYIVSLAAAYILVGIILTAFFSKTSARA